MNGLLDTNILIDVSRRYAPTLNWLQNNQLVFAVSSLTRMELVLGARNKTEQQKVVALLKSYQLVYPNDADAKWAMEQFEVYYLSHQIEIIDCFIAATAVRLKLPIYTRNIKHLSVLPGVTLQIPCS